MQIEFDKFSFKYNMPVSLKKYLTVCQLEASSYSETPDAWFDVWRQLAYRPVAAQRSMLAYQQAYLEGAGQTVHDLSLILRSDGRPVGLLPLCLQQVGSLWKISSMGAAVSSPLFTAGLSPRTVKKLCTRTLAVLQQFARDLGQDELLTEQPCWPSSDGPTSSTEWHQQLMSVGAIIQTRHDLFADLSPDLATIRSTFRKSYRPLINVALKTWHASVMDADNADPNTWIEFKQLHKDVAGRSTRSDRTWLIQWGMVQARDAFLVTLRDPSNQRLIGAGLFQFTADEGLYAVGAYDRALFDKPLGHAVQQRAIESLKALGVRWYQVGERHYSQSAHAPSAKEVAISEFKQGFSSHLFCRHQFALALRQPAGATEVTQ